MTNPITSNHVTTDVTTAAAIAVRVEGHVTATEITDHVTAAGVTTDHVIVDAMTTVGADRRAKMKAALATKMARKRFAKSPFMRYYDVTINRIRVTTEERKVGGAGGGRKTGKFAD